MVAAPPPARSPKPPPLHGSPAASPTERAGSNAVVSKRSFFTVSCWAFSEGGWGLWVGGAERGGVGRAGDSDGGGGGSGVRVGHAAATVAAAPAATLPTEDGCVMRKKASAKRPVSETAPLVSWTRTARDSARRVASKVEETCSQTAASSDASGGSSLGSGKKKARRSDGGKARRSGARPTARPAEPTIKPRA